MELKIYGIFEYSKIVPSPLERKVKRQETIDQRRGGFDGINRIYEKNY
jgi:hypothetical protein